MAREPPLHHWNTHASNVKPKGERDVLVSRAKAGFGGMITVSSVLLAIQLITRLQGFLL